MGDTKNMFGYLRIFGIVSLIIIAILAIGAGISFRGMAMEDLTVVAERNSKSLAQGYINAVWKKHREVMVPLTNDPALLKGNPKVTEFAQDTWRYFQQMPLARVNIYSAKGLLLMSANIDPNGKIVGATASPDANFVAERLRATGIGSHVLNDVEVQGGQTATMLQTIVPVIPDGAASAECTLELLGDITIFWTDVTRVQYYATGGVIFVFLIFLGVLFLTSKRAEGIIAKQHEANIELAATAASAQAQNQEKSQFLANVSHELRTPLNAIIGFSEIIKTEALQREEEKKYLDYITDINSSGVHLLSLINDILDYSKAEAGKLELEVSEVSANKMVQNCLRLVSPRAEAANVILVEALPKDQQFTLVTDSKKFKQVLLNLLSNAVKFTPPNGEVRVTCWQNVTDECIYFEVRDSGIGIAPKDISRAMAPFGQVDNTLKRKYEGTGLGLPLTKKFVELMGGKFNIESTLNVGTTITFSLPLEVKQREGIVIKQAS